MFEAGLMQKLIDSSDAVIYLKDEQECFLMINRQFEALFKLSKDQIIGKTDYDLATKEQADQWRANDRQVAEASIAMNFEEPAVFPDGPLRTFVSHKFPVSNIEGHPNAVGGISIELVKGE